MTDRYVRFQGLIIRDHKILIIRGFEISTGISFWVIPGGHQEAGESEEECIIREMREETHLEVQVEKLVMEQTFPLDGPDAVNKSFLCTPIGGQLKPGSEPDDDNFEIAALRWFDLRDEMAWSMNLQKDPYTYPQLVRIRQILGYTPKT
jgi:8-oxo-dGTP pyrophosphatase MutT (NUDIX family)